MTDLATTPTSGGTSLTGAVLAHRSGEAPLANNRHHQPGRECVPHRGRQRVIE